MTDPHENKPLKTASQLIAKPSLRVSIYDDSEPLKEMKRSESTLGDLATAVTVGVSAEIATVGASAASAVSAVTLEPQTIAGNPSGSTAIAQGLPVQGGLEIRDGSIITAGDEDWRGEDYYLSPRTDGVPGRGTALDPIDVSTAEKLDAFFDSVGDVPARFFLQEGIYFANQDHEWRVKNGWHLRGAGMDKTFIRLNKSTSIHYRAWWYSGDSAFDDLSHYIHDGSVRDLTIDGQVTDADMAAQLAEETLLIKVHAISLQGSNITVERVRALRCGGLAGEIFPISLGSNWEQDQPCQLLVQHCIVQDTQCGPSGSTAIILAGGNGASTNPGENIRHTGRIVYNKILNGGYLGVSNFSGFEIAHNYIWADPAVAATGSLRGTSYGINIDTGVCRHGKIRHNIFRNGFHTYGAGGGLNSTGTIDIGGGGTYDDIEISQNFIETLQNGFAYGGVRFKGNVTNAKVLFNAFASDNYGASFVPFLIRGTGNEEPMMYGNSMANGDVHASLADNVIGGLTVSGDVIAPVVAASNYVQGDKLVADTEIKVGQGVKVDAYSINETHGDNITAVARELTNHSGSLVRDCIYRTGGTVAGWRKQIDNGATDLRLNTTTGVMASTISFKDTGNVDGLIADTTLSWPRLNATQGITMHSAADWPADASAIPAGHFVLWHKTGGTPAACLITNIGGVLHYGIVLTTTAP